jgi:hypothetical protein
MVDPAQPRSYYGQPVLVAPIWNPEIGIYFFVGGVAGASAPLALVASVRGEAGLARAASAAALAGAAISPVLLIKDLGKPSRFLNMLRVFKVTSPMSVGSWVLSAFGAAATLGAARELLGLVPRAGRAGQVAAAALGPLLSTYTAALIANTAVPVWHEARDELPFVFAASSAATAGALAVAVTAGPEAQGARRLAVGGAVAELALVALMEHRLGPAGAPLHRGRPGLLGRAAKLLTAAGALALAPAGRRTRAAAVAGGTAILAGGALERYAIFRAGTASAEDAAATVGPQRARLRRRRDCGSEAASAGRARA